ncbi:uncharacterized protein LOC143245181 isoform X2 [Tachypleus tridentatus]|uniref:uncharacterized protein LOC143245181 isoform X2 n=1 Tax=Tachypleus tridentatus TaxID=6853 RepID=UPI003FD1A8BE
MRVRCLCACRALLLLYSVTLFVKTQPLSVTIDDFRSRETPHDDEIEKDIEIMKRRLLRELGMSETPEVSEVNISKSEMDRVLEIYHQNAQIADSEEMMGEYDTIRQFYTFRDQGRSGCLTSITKLMQMIVYLLLCVCHERSVNLYFVTCFGRAHSRDCNQNFQPKFQHEINGRGSCSSISLQDFQQDYFYITQSAQAKF